MRAVMHLIFVVLLTILTQIGGLVWLINVLIFRLYRRESKSWVKLSSFIVFYLVISFLVVRPIAKLSGRIALPIRSETGLVAHNVMTVLMNRHYVKPELRKQLEEISIMMKSEEPHLELAYLDANFPFLDGFPLLPHLSHKDGLKVDLAFYYLEDGKSVNKKPSNSGYGHFEEAKGGETNQTKFCKSQGYWQYDFTKYLTFGTRKDLQLDVERTRLLLQRILRDTRTEKVLLEPHLKNRMGLISNKVRFQGCHSVRHDDHIHVQIEKR